MSLLKSRKTGIDTLAVEAQNNPQILLLDVRANRNTGRPYSGSVHLELAEAETIGDIAPDLNQTLSMCIATAECAAARRVQFTGVWVTPMSPILAALLRHGPVEKGIQNESAYCWWGCGRCNGSGQTSPSE